MASEPLFLCKAEMPEMTMSTQGNDCLVHALTHDAAPQDQTQTMRALRKEIAAGVLERRNLTLNGKTLKELRPPGRKRVIEDSSEEDESVAEDEGVPQAAASGAVSSTAVLSAAGSSKAAAVRWHWQRLPPLCKRPRLGQGDEGRRVRQALREVFHQRCGEWASSLPTVDDELTAFCEHFNVSHAQIKDQFKNWLSPSATWSVPSEGALGGVEMRDADTVSGDTAGDAPLPAPCLRAWLHHDLYEALEAAQRKCTAKELHELRATNPKLSHITEEDVRGAIVRMGQRGWVVLEPPNEARSLDTAFDTLRRYHWITDTMNGAAGTATERDVDGAAVGDVPPGCDGQGVADEAREAEEVSAAVNLLCDGGAAVRPSTPAEWAEHVRALREREQHKAVRLVTAELEDVDGWKRRLEELKRGAEAARVARSLVRQTGRARERVNPEWPRALLDAPCGWGKTVVGFKIARSLFEKYGAHLGAVVVFEHRLGLIRQVIDEWVTWASVEKVSLDLSVVCSPLARRRKGAGASRDSADSDEDEQAEADERREWKPPEGCVRLNQEQVKSKLRAPAEAGKLRVLFVCYDSAQLLRDAYSDLPSSPPWIGLAIFDEAHTTAVKRTEAEDSHDLALYDDNVPIMRRLFMTATTKVHKVRMRQSEEDPSDESASMAHAELYGSVMRGSTACGARYSLRFDQAIERGLIADYKLLVIAVETVEAKALLDRLASASLVDVAKDWKKKWEDEIAAIEVAKVKALQHALVERKLTKGFIFNSRKKYAELMGELTAAFIDDLGRAQYVVHSGFSEDQNNAALKGFTNAEGKAVLSNVRSLTTGTNVPSADLAMFATSKENTLDTVQAAGRAMRLDLPMLDSDGTVARAGNKTKLAHILLCLFEMDESSKPKTSSSAQQQAEGRQRGTRAGGGAKRAGGGGDSKSVFNVLKAFQSIDSRLDGMVKGVRNVLISGRLRNLTTLDHVKPKVRELAQRFEICAEEAAALEIVTKAIDICSPHVELRIRLERAERWCQENPGKRIKRDLIIDVPEWDDPRFAMGFWLMDVRNDNARLAKAERLGLKDRILALPFGVGNDTFADRIKFALSYCETHTEIRIGEKDKVDPPPEWCWEPGEQFLIGMIIKNSRYNPQRVKELEDGDDLWARLNAPTINCRLGRFSGVDGLTKETKVHFLVKRGKRVKQSDHLHVCMRDFAAHMNASERERMNELEQTGACDLTEVWKVGTFLCNLFRQQDTPEELIDKLRNIYHASSRGANIKREEGIALLNEYLEKNPWGSQSNQRTHFAKEDVIPTLEGALQRPFVWIRNALNSLKETMDKSQHTADPKEVAELEQQRQQLEKLRDGQKTKWSVLDKLEWLQTDAEKQLKKDPGFRIVIGELIETPWDGKFDEGLFLSGVKKRLKKQPQGEETARRKAILDSLPYGHWGHAPRSRTYLTAGS